MRGTEGKTSNFPKTPKKPKKTWGGYPVKSPLLGERGGNTEETPGFYRRKGESGGGVWVPPPIFIKKRVQSSFLLQHIPGRYPFLRDGKKSCFQKFIHYTFERILQDYFDFDPVLECKNRCQNYTAKKNE